MEQTTSIKLIIKLGELTAEDDYREYCSLLKQLTEINPDNFTESAFRVHLARIKSNPNHKIIIAKTGNKIIGSITLLIEPKFIHDLNNVGHIEDVVVDTAYRKHGIGKMLVDYAIELCREIPCYKVILDCSAKNVNFYKKSGFVEKELQMVRYMDRY